MPKVIEGAEKRILETARELLFLEGYKKLTMRDVAKRCGIASGTIYNYFPNKDMLIAVVMLEDWENAMDQMKSGCQSAQDIAAGVKAIYDGIVYFAKIYEPIWAEYGFSGSMASGFGERHLMLRHQIATMLCELFDRFGRPHDKDIAPLFAETILACAMQKDMDYNALEQFLNRLFNE